MAGRIAQSFVELELNDVTHKIPETKLKATLSAGLLFIFIIFILYFCILLSSFVFGARCSSVVSAFVHGATCRLIDSPWWTH